MTALPVVCSGLAFWGVPAFLDGCHRDFGGSRPAQHLGDPEVQELGDALGEVTRMLFGLRSRCTTSRGLRVAYGVADRTEKR